MSEDELRSAWEQVTRLVAERMAVADRHIAMADGFLRRGRQLLAIMWLAGFVCGAMFTKWWFGL